jgi:hypothetical protein
MVHPDSPKLTSNFLAKKKRPDEATARDGSKTDPQWQHFCLDAVVRWCIYVDAPMDIVNAISMPARGNRCNALICYPKAALRGVFEVSRRDGHAP